MQKTSSIFFALLVASTASAAQHIHAEGKLTAVPTVGENQFELRLKNHDGSPIVGGKVTLTVYMPGMEKDKSLPIVREGQGGVYKATVKFSMSGRWRVTASSSAKGVE